MEIINYSEKALLVKGDTRPHKEQLKEIGGKWNPTLKGWIFSKRHTQEVEALVQKISNVDSPVRKTSCDPRVFIPPVPDKAQQNPDLDFGTALEEVVEEKVCQLLRVAETIWKWKVPEIPITFDLTGVKAGVFQCPNLETLPEGAKIRFNNHLMKENFDQFLKSTVPHETAHYVTIYACKIRYGVEASKKLKPHGQEWRYTMEAFGVESENIGGCHSYDLENIKKLSGKYDYQLVCECKSHQVSKTRYQRAKNGTKYICKKCKGVLKIK
jgi:SprT protein